MSYLLIFLLLGFIILVHELGHFTAAKLVGIPVKQFSIGFGKVLYRYKIGATDYCISLLPLGGYVCPDIEDEGDFYRIPCWKRVSFAISGPLANLLFAAFCFAIFNIINNNITPFSIFIEPFLQTGNYVYRFTQSIPALFANPDRLSGIIGIVSQGGTYTGLNISRIIQFAIMLNINLAMLNLLPITPLDGGNILIFLTQRLFPKMQKVHIPAAIAGWVLLISLMLYATYLDISKICIA